MPIYQHAPHAAHACLRIIEFQRRLFNACFWSAHHPRSVFHSLLTDADFVGRRTRECLSGRPMKRSRARRKTHRVCLALYIRSRNVDTWNISLSVRLYTIQVVQKFLHCTCRNPIAYRQQAMEKQLSIAECTPLTSQRSTRRPQADSDVQVTAS